MLKMINQKNTMFYLFLFVNAICWTLIQLFRNAVGDDALEAISWGSLADFGTNKHPPLSGWLAGGFYNILGQHDFAVYILGQICILLGSIFIYKLAKFFIEDEKALCAPMILSSSYYYTFIIFKDSFNCNVLSMWLWPMIIYYFYKSLKMNKITDWILFGISSGLGVLAKYQIAFLFLAMFIYLIICERKQFKQKGLYIAFVTGLLIILPHIIWLYKTDFFSFIYITGRTNIGAHNTPTFLVRFGRVFFPIKFLADQILSLLPCIILYILLAIQAKNIKYKNENGKTEDKIFLLILGIAPILIQGMIPLLTGTRVMGVWGSIMVSMAGIMLFYFFPIEFKQNTYKFFIKSIYVIMSLWLISMFIFSQLQTKLAISYPYQTIMKDFDSMWNSRTNNAPLKYVGGYLSYVFQFNVYNKNHPTVILETFNHENPWIDPEDVIKSGAIILVKKPEQLEQKSRELITMLPENYRIIPEKYEFTITNKWKTKSKNYVFYYVIIPPLNMIQYW